MLMQPFQSLRASTNLAESARNVRPSCFRSAGVQSTGILRARQYIRVHSVHGTAVRNPVAHRGYNLVVAQAHVHTGPLADKKDDQCSQLERQFESSSEPDVFKKYMRGRHLGKGGFGEVSLVTNRETGKQYALKAVPKDPPVRAPKQGRSQSLYTSEYEAEYKAKLKTESRILDILSEYPEVVDFEEVLEDATHVYFVMEVCKGGTIQEYLQEHGHFVEKDAARVAAVVLRFLQRCHAKGVVYRDIKPSNFMFKKPVERAIDCSVDNKLVAIDFGQSAQLESEYDFLTSRSGTPAFMAPEVILREYGPEADIWSAGILFYFMLSGGLPFWESIRGLSVTDTYQGILENDVQFTADVWTEISEEAQDFLLQILKKKPSLRPSISELLEHPWLVHH